MLLAYVSIGAGIFVICAGLTTTCHNYCNTESENHGTSISLKDLAVNNTQQSLADCYRKWKSGSSFKEAFYSYLAVCELTTDVNTSVEICKQLYEEERFLNNPEGEHVGIILSSQKGNRSAVDRTDLFF